MQIVSSLPFNDFICKIRYDYYEMKVILIPILCCCNNCCCSLQAKKWCSSLSSSHIDDELGDPCPKIDLGHFLLSFWWCSCPNYLDRVAHTKPYPVISQALMRLLFCKLLLLLKFRGKSFHFNQRIFHILCVSQSSHYILWSTRKQYK